MDLALGDVRAFADALPHLLWIARADGTIDFVNRAWCEFTGRDVGALRGSGWTSALPPQDVAAAVRSWEGVRDAGQAADVGLRVVHVDGAMRRVRGRTVPVRDASGAIAYWVGWCAAVDEGDGNDDPLRALAREQAYLSKAGGAINASLDLEQTVWAIARYALPDLADWCEVDLVEREGVVTRAFAHRDAAIQERVKGLIGRVHERSPSEAYERIAQAMRGGKAVTARRVDAELAFAVVEDPAARELYALAGYASSIILPLAARGRVIGALALVRTDPARPHEARDVRVAEEFASRASLAIDNALIFGREHRVAEAMQAASLPKTLPQLATVDMHAIYVPGRPDASIGGDWYDAFRLRDGRLVVSIGDVSGSGVEAAVTMSNMRQIIRGTAQVHADPVLMLNAADRALRLEDTELFVTAFVAVIDSIRRTIVYGNAGHPPPYVRDASGGLKKLEFEGLPLGLRGRSVDRPATVTVEEDSTLIFYTDGLIESTHNILAGIDALEAALASPAFASAPNPAKFVRANVLGGGARDDVAILTVRLRAPDRENPSDVTRLLFRWRYERIDHEISRELRERLRGTLASRGFDEETRERAVLVLGELVGNIARHAPGALEVIVDLTDRLPVLHVIDEGPGFERAPMLPGDLLSESGRGLYIVSELTDEFSVARGAHGGSHARAVLGRSADR